MSSSRDSDEDITWHKRVNEANDLNHDTKRARKEPEADDEALAARKLKHVHFEKTLKLNIGGHLFTTSLETVTKDPSSMLYAMFSERFGPKPSEDGSYFIDRDGTHFRYILNFLRTRQLIVPKDEIIRKELLVEAEFYQVEGIINGLTARPFKLDSEIVPSDQRQTLLNWLKDTRPLTTGNWFPVLLYRASRDGWTGANFHSCCDNKGPTVIVVSGGNDIFGGYTEERWKGASEVTIRRPDSFLFNPSDGQKEDQAFTLGAGSFRPFSTISSPKQQTACSEHAVCCFRNCGHVFKDGCDPVIVNAPNDPNNCSVSLNDRKYVTEDQYPSFFNVSAFSFGSQRTTDHVTYHDHHGPRGSNILREMEVFGFEK
ncbi:hypothetical protein ACROYT_G044296 [Oculina patagonica]